MPLLSNESVAESPARGSRAAAAIAALVGEELGPEVPVARIDRGGVVGVELGELEVVLEVHAQASITSPIRVHAADQRLGDHVVGVADLARARQACGGRLALETLLRPLDHRRRPRRNRPARTGSPGAAVDASSPRRLLRGRSGPDEIERAVPVGWMCASTLLTCCCRMTLGKIVVITAVGPFHHASGTMSSARR